MDDDFLWDCALHLQNRNRLDIIPDYEDDMRHFCSDNLTKASSLGGTFHLSSSIQVDSPQDINICITESRGNGVLDIIGGELWEGALLLCVYILQNQDLFLVPDVLELGSGVGLPGLLLAQLKASAVSNSVAKSAGDITLTDNDPRVVSNLSFSAMALGGAKDNHEQEKDNIKSAHRSITSSNSVALHAKLLDWSVFAAHNNANDDTESASSKTSTSSTLLPDAAIEVSSGCEVIMGCELCYAPYHAQCLAELLRYYLSHGFCKKVIICQMRDREGFTELLSRLDSMGIVYTIHEITENQYELAQCIRCRKVISGSTHTAPITDRHARSRADSEDDDVISKMFTFPTSIYSATNNTVNTANESVAIDNGSIDHLLHSAKENFVFLTIG